MPIPRTRLEREDVRPRQRGIVSFCSWHTCSVSVGRRGISSRNKRSHCCVARLLELQDHPDLEQSGELRVTISPGHRHELDPVLGTFHPRNLGAEDRLELAGAQVPPAAEPGVVSRAGFATNRARQPLLAIGDRDLDGLLEAVQADFDDVPGLLIGRERIALGQMLTRSRARRSSWSYRSSEISSLGKPACDRSQAVWGASLAFLTSGAPHGGGSRGYGFAMETLGLMIVSPQEGGSRQWLLLFRTDATFASKIVRELDSTQASLYFFKLSQFPTRSRECERLVS